MAAQLSARALVTFLQEMVVDGSTSREDKPVLLQIRSIIPVLREGDLWPNQGFFLRVSDLSHAIYVSLPQEDDDMVLYDKLHIGQFLFVDKLEAAYPVPLLKGIRPLPGRHPCVGDPKDLIPLQVLEKFLGVSKLDSSFDDQKDVVKKPVQEPELEERRRSSRNCFSGMSSNEESSDGVGEVSLIKEENLNVGGIHEKHFEKPPISPGLGRTRSLTPGDQDGNEKIRKQPDKSLRGSLSDKPSRRSSMYRPRKSEDVESTLSYRSKRNDGESYYKGLRKCKPRYTKNSDAKSSISTAGTSTVFKRKSWTGREAPTRIGDVAESHVVKLEVKPDISCPGISIPLADSPRNDSSDDNQSTITKKTVTSIAIKSSKTPRQNSISDSDKISEDSFKEEVSCSSINDQIAADINISWDLLPSSLVKLGQEVLQQREIAFLAAMEALLEASGAERLLKCLSIYSEVQSAKKAEEHHQSVDKFLSLEHDLSQTKPLFQKPETDHPTRETQIAIFRTKNALECIKTALESNIKSVPTYDTSATKTITEEKIKPKSTLTPRKQKTKTEVHCGTEKRKDWVKGCGLQKSEELGNCLSNESNKWFLKYVEEYLNWIGSKNDTCSSEPDIQEPEMMFRIKKVSDWLDMRCKDKNMEDSEMEACRQVRSKIYEILLTHVERTARNAVAEA
ncbi:hypothetical protein M5689_000331 [Euphorbia peplus]|nr:hypothetical protein M5689_000331 [Euphorbia peplus]